MGSMLMWKAVFALRRDYIDTVMFEKILKVLALIDVFLILFVMGDYYIPIQKSELKIYADWGGQSAYESGWKSKGYKSRLRFIETNKGEMIYLSPESQVIEDLMPGDKFSTGTTKLFGQPKFLYYHKKAENISMFGSFGNTFQYIFIGCFTISLILLFKPIEFIETIFGGLTLILWVSTFFYFYFY